MMQKNELLFICLHENRQVTQEYINMVVQIVSYDLKGITIFSDKLLLKFWLFKFLDKNLNEKRFASGVVE